MMRRAIAPLIVIALGLTMSGVAVAGDPTVDTVVSFDPAKGELPEGLAITDRGVIYVGFAPTGEIVKVRDDGSVSPVATLESSVASFTRCASPPDSVVAGCPSRR